MSDTPTIIDAMDDPHLFARWFKNPESWKAWRSFLCALFGLPMSDDGLRIFKECTARAEAPSMPATEGWLICGRKGGKSFIMALCAVYLACFKSYREYLAPGEVATVLIIATDRRQARAVMRFIRGMLTEIPMLKDMVERETAESFELSNGVCIEVATASFRTTRGYAICAAICDELAYWRNDDSSAEPDREILAAIRPGMAQFPTGLLLCASSPYARKGALHDAWRKHFTKTDDPILVWKAPTRTMNPTVSQSYIDAAYEHDAADASAEYGAEFRSDLEDFVSREAVLACVENGQRERPPQPSRFKHFSFVDPSGGSSDSMTCAVGHREGDVVVVDAIREITSPFDPESATDEFADLFRRYDISETHGDRYAAAWVSQAFEKRKIKYHHAEAPKSGLYLNLLPLLNSKTIRLLDVPRAINQICNLERKTHRGGRDSIDHAEGAHDDVANAIAGLAYVIVNKKQIPQASFGYYGTYDSPRSAAQRRPRNLSTPSKFDGLITDPNDPLFGGYATTRK